MDRVLPHFIDCHFVVSSCTVSYPLALMSPYYYLLSIFRDFNLNSTTRTRSRFSVKIFGIVNDHDSGLIVSTCLNLVAFTWFDNSKFFAVGYCCLLFL